MKPAWSPISGSEIRPMLRSTWRENCSSSSPTRRLRRRRESAALRDRAGKPACIRRRVRRGAFPRFGGGMIGRSAARCLSGTLARASMVKGDILIAVDAGTSVIKAVAFSLRAIPSRWLRGPTAMRRPGPGQVEQDMHRTWADCVATVRGIALTEFPISRAGPRVWRSPGRATEPG